MTDPSRPGAPQEDPRPPERVPVLLRLPADLVAAADALANEQSVSRSAILVAALTHAVEHPSDWIAEAKDGRVVRWERERGKQPPKGQQKR